MNDISAEMKANLQEITDKKKFIAFEKKKKTVIMHIIAEGCEILSDTIKSINDMDGKPNLEELLEGTFNLITECVYYVTGANIEYKKQGQLPNIVYKIYYYGEELCEIKTDMIIKNNNEEGKAE